MYYAINLRMIVFYLSHLFSVSFWVERSFCQQHWVFLGSYTQLVVECVMPDLKSKKGLVVIEKA